jgi:biopolymer transport protein ExbB
MEKTMQMNYKTTIKWMILAGCLLVTGPLLSYAQEAVPPPTQGESPANEQITVLKLILSGGPVMIPLGFASIIALAITFERMNSLQKRKLIPQDFMRGLKDAYDSDPGDLEKAIRYCEGHQGPVGRIFKSGLINIDRGMDKAEKAVEDAGGKEVDKLKRSLRGLAIIASVSPLLGLLGTVYGMIEAFQKATDAGMGKANVLAGGIYEALVTTATGLTIAVPALLIFQYFSARVDAIVDDIDDMGIDFIEHIHQQGKSSSPDDPREAS